MKSKNGKDERLFGVGSYRGRVILSFESQPLGRIPSLDAYLGQVDSPVWLVNEALSSFVDT